MTDEELQALLQTTVQEALTARFLVTALVQYLIERGVLKGEPEEVLSILDLWAKDLQQEESNRLWVEERVRALKEAWTKLPKQ